MTKRQTPAPEPPRTVLVREGDHGLPYSKGLMANTMAAAGLSLARAHQVAQVIEERLRERGHPSISANDLRRLTVEVIRAEAGERWAEAYQKWMTVNSLDLPMIILIGGGTGVGKSTIATLIAARLGIVRLISTDAIREVMKGTISRDFMPTLYTSSFDTGEVVKAKSPRAEDAVLVGFRDQVSAVAVGIKALVERSITEGTDIIIEGAHVVPGFLDVEKFSRDAVIVPVVIQVEDEELHRSHFYVRAHETRARPVERYLAHFANIRKIQKYIKSLALQHGVPIISNYNLDSCISSVIEQVIDRAMEATSTRPGRPPKRVRAIRGGSR